MRNKGTKCGNGWSVILIRSYYARFVNVNPEDALEKTNKKFIQRFQYMEKQIKAKGQELSDLTLKEMDVYWNEAKTI